MEKKTTFFVNQLKKLLLEKGLTQKELADKLKVTKSFVSIYFNGKQEPKPATIHKIAKALNVPPSYFIDEGQKNFVENSGTIGAIGNNNSVNMEEKIKDHEIRLLKLENELLKKKLGE